MVRPEGQILDRLKAHRLAVEAADEEGGRDLAEALLRARARRLAAPRGLAVEADERQEVLCVRVATERYALSLAQLSEVMVLGKWTPIPGQPQYLLGVTNLRGEIRPVLDLNSLLGLPAPESAARTWVVFLKAGGAEIGVRVEGVERVVRLDLAALTRPHESGNGLPQRFISGITADGLILLDTVQILALEILQDARIDSPSDS
ncbi:MAG: chemotaxis protein CheW [Magnetospirillum sp.]|nr:chemotaxis protein CheW [Magnetospirillum sp.]